ncbi:MAG: hypothetical protein U1E25_08390 [Methylocystis sp.]
MFWTPSRRPRNWVSSAQCWEGFASDFAGAITADTLIIITPVAITRVIADACASPVIIVTAAVAVAAVVEAAAVRPAAWARPISDR